MSGLDFLERASGKIPAGLFALATQLVAGYNVYRHLANYTEPRIQRYTIRIILMVPIYALSSFFSLMFPSIAFYLDTIRNCYEAYVLYNFLSLCLYYVGGPNELVLHWETDDAQGVLQFVIVKVVLTLAALVLELAGGYADGSWSFDHGYMYVTIFYNISIAVALYALIVFYLTAEPYLRPHRPLLKFIMVKAVIFVTYWQSLLLSLLFFVGTLQPIAGRTEDETSGMLQNFLICLECLPGALLSWRGFPPRAHAMPEDRGARQVLQSLKHAISVADVLQDTEHAFDRKYGQFVMMSSPRDGPAHLPTAAASNSPRVTRFPESKELGMSDVHVGIPLSTGELDPSPRETESGTNERRLEGNG